MCVEYFEDEVGVFEDVVWVVERFYVGEDDIFKVLFEWDCVECFVENLFYGDFGGLFDFDFLVVMFILKEGFIDCFRLVGGENDEGIVFFKFIYFGEE